MICMHPVVVVSIDTWISYEYVFFLVSLQNWRPACPHREIVWHSPTLPVSADVETWEFSNRFAGTVHGGLTLLTRCVACLVARSSCGGNCRWTRIHTSILLMRECFSAKRLKLVSHVAGSRVVIMALEVLWQPPSVGVFFCYMLCSPMMALFV